MSPEIQTFFETINSRARLRHMFDAGIGWWRQQGIFSEMRGDDQLMNTVYHEARLVFRGREPVGTCEEHLWPTESSQSTAGNRAMKPWMIKQSSNGRQRLKEMQREVSPHRSERDRIEFRRLYREHLKRLRNRYEKENGCRAPTVDDEVLKWSIGRPYK